MLKLLARCLSRFRLRFMMGEPVESVQRKMHGFDGVLVIIRGGHHHSALEFAMEFRHRECCLLVANRSLVLFCAKGSMIADDLIRDKNSLVVYTWTVQYG